MAPRQVLLYGRSLLLSLVADSLGQRSGLHVVQAATWEMVRHLLVGHTPDVLIFDLDNSHESHILPLLLKHPNLLLIGLDPEYNQAVLLSGQGTSSLTLNQLEQIVRRAAPPLGEPP